MRLELQASSLLSTVFSERVVAFGASEKLRRRLITTPRLDLPHKRLIIPTFRAFNTHGRQNTQFLFFLADDGYSFLWTVLYDFGYGLHFLSR